MSEIKYYKVGDENLFNLLQSLENNVNQLKGTFQNEAVTSSPEIIEFFGMFDSTIQKLHEARVKCADFLKNNQITKEQYDAEIASLSAPRTPIPSYGYLEVDAEVMDDEEDDLPF